MQIREFRYVTTLARVLNFTKAAEELGISQPVLSRSIQAIETRHRLRLFDREKGRVHLTGAGSDFAARAAVLLRQVEDLELRLRRTAEGEVGELFFGMTQIVAKALMSKTLLTCLAASPELSVRAVVRPSPEFPHLLENREVEFYLSSKMFFPDPPGVKSLSIGHFPVRAMVRSGHPLLASLFNGDSSFRKLSTTQLAGSSFTPRFLGSCVEEAGPIVIEDLDSLISVAESTDAVFIGTPFAALESLDAGRLVLLPVPPGEQSINMEIKMYSLNGRTLSPVALRILDIIRSEVRILWTGFEKR